MGDMPRNSDEQTNRSYSFSHMQKGADYANRFLVLPGRSLMWEMEKQVVLRQLPKVGDRGSYLDFAAGTGRLLSLVASQFDRSWALDISGEMLTIAREACPSAVIVNADFRADPAPLSGLSFDLITSFRFFPNAEPDLRQCAMAYIARHLKPGGYAMVNNHRGHWSVPYVTLRLAGLGAKARGMRDAEMMSLALGHGLRLAHRFSLGVVPQTERKAVLPWSAVRAIEMANCRWLATSHLLGYNTIYLFQKLR
jgi:ubiquinone/menaquinone biosynthesis C-methylase UbiE